MELEAQFIYTDLYFSLFILDWVWGTVPFQGETQKRGCAGTGWVSTEWLPLPANTSLSAWHSLGKQGHHIPYIGRQHCTEIHLSWYTVLLIPGSWGISWLWRQWHPVSLSGRWTIQTELRVHDFPASQVTLRSPGVVAHLAWSDTALLKSVELFCWGFLSPPEDQVFHCKPWGALLTTA